MTSDTIGARLKKLRKALKLTQESFASALGIDRGHIGNIENNTRQPSESLIKHICLRYGVSESWLKTGEGEMLTSPRELVENIIAWFGIKALADAFYNAAGLHLGTACQGASQGALSESGNLYFQQDNEADNPEEAVKSAAHRTGMGAAVKAFNSVLGSHPESGMTVPPAEAAETAGNGDFPEGPALLGMVASDPELKRIIKTLLTLWTAGDERLKGWASVQFDRAFPADVVQKAQKRQRGTGRKPPTG